ncbi:MAG TPA: transposase [Acidobacteriaceae bacterium]|jgi:putative transposase
MVQSETSRDGTFFVTTVANERRRIFQAERTAQLLIETLQHYRHEGRYRLHAFVVMPDHVHLLITPQDTTIERAVGLIKGGFSHRLRSKLQVWQTGYVDHRCRNAEEFIARRE